MEWDKIQLAPGKSKTGKLTIDRQALSIFDGGKTSWELMPGESRIHVGGSSRNTPLQASVKRGGD